MKKGSLVRLKKDAPESHGVRPPTQEELDFWYASDESKGMDSAGETKLPPRTTHVALKPTDLFVVSRARAAAPVGWGRPLPGMTLVRRVEGCFEPFYIRREDLEEV